MDSSTNRFLSGILAIAFSVAAMAQDDNYIHVSDDLGRGVELQEVADRAYKNSDDYWGRITGLNEHDGSDEELSAGEAVTEIYTKAALNRNNTDPLALDIVQVTLAVVDSWSDCQDTFDAVRAAVTLMPGKADEIVANVAVKRDCNCSNGGIWVDQRTHDRVRVKMRHQILDVPSQCSCSQIAMYAGVAGLPENREFNEDLPEARKAELIARMTESVTTITERTTALQNKKDWECGCTDVNIAATMQGIKDDGMRDGTYDALAQKYADEANDTGLIVDSFGVVGLQPMEHWGDKEHGTRSNTLRRKPEVYRGDNQVLDPFHPATEFVAYGENNFDHVGQHSHSLGGDSTDLIISEYIEGWTEEALASPIGDRDPEQHNRVIELYNGSDKTIDLGNGQYFLEIHAGAETSPRQVIGLSGSVEPDATYVIAFNESDEALTENAHMVTGQLDFKPNETLILRRLGGEMALNCRALGYSYVMNYPAMPWVKPTTGPDPSLPPVEPPASPN